MDKKTFAIMGAGGAGRSLLALLRNVAPLHDDVCFFEESEFYQQRDVDGVRVRDLAHFDPERWQIFIALGTPAERARIAAELPAETVFARCVHPLAFLLEDTEIPPGSVLYPHVYLSRNVRLGAHALLMPGTVVGHDSVLGDFFTSSTHVAIGGHAQIGHRVFCGMHSAVRDRVQIGDDCTLGMGAMAVRHLAEPGVYIGSPARLKSQRL